MKKIKILSLLLALLMCASTLLIGCGKKETACTITDIMNHEWKLDKQGIITSFKDISLAGDFVKAGENFIVTKYDPSTVSTEGADNKGSVVTRVYNVEKKQVVATLTETATVDESVTPAVTTTEKHYVDIISEDYFAVITVSAKGNESNSMKLSNYFGCALNEKCEYTLTIRDASGAIVETFYNGELIALCNGNISNFDYIYAGNKEYGFSEENAINYEYKNPAYHLNDSYEYSDSFDLIAIGSKVYRFDNEFNTTLVKDYGLAAMPSLTKMTRVGSTYLEVDGGVYTVYDSSLNKVFSYNVPGYAQGRGFLLTNGNLLVQYVVQLDQNDKKFDIRAEADKKYDLVTVLVTPEETSELKDVDYYIADVETTDAKLDGKKVYADTVENLAFIYPISENKMLDTSYANKKLVLLSNDGTVTSEVALDGEIADFPIQYRNTFYAVKLSDGSYSIYDKTGEKKGTLSSAAIFADVLDTSYLRIGDVIYNADGSVSYDIGKDHANYQICGDTVVISKYSTNSVAYGIFVDGQVKNIGTVSSDEKIATIDEFNSSNYGYYYVYNKADNKYTYYNSDGAVIGTFDNRLTSRFLGEDCVIMQDVKNKIFYMFEMTK